MLAGRDTTASTLSWTFFELARHPETLKKLRDEIVATVGLERAPTYGNLKGMKYLQVCYYFSSSVTYRSFSNNPRIQGCMSFARLVFP